MPAKKELTDIIDKMRSFLHQLFVVTMAKHILLGNVTADDVILAPVTLVSGNTRSDHEATLSRLHCRLTLFGQFAV